MDPDDSADVFTILGLAGAGAALMLVGVLDLKGAAVVLAVVVPALVAILSTVVNAVVFWVQTRYGDTTAQGANHQWTPTGISHASTSARVTVRMSR
jgi:hypothetical protein